jgi:hypothetical protein
MPETDEQQNINISELNMEIKQINDKLKLIPTKDEMRLAIKEGIEEALVSCETKYASKDRVSMLERVVYGTVGAILLAFLGALIGLVVIK